MKEKLKNEKERKIKQKSQITLHKSHNSGITLVALIITIIVLLILAVVSIRAVQGDGIITKAKEAKSKTTVAQEQEQILLAVNEWKIQKNYQNEPGSFKSFMEDKLSDVATIPDSDPDDGPLTVTINDTGNKYIVYDNGTIGEPWINNGKGTLTKGSETVEIGKTTYTNAYVLEKLGLKEYTGTYNGDWQVIGAKGDKLKLVSTNNVTTQDYDLGYEDQKAKENVAVADERNVTDAEKLQRAAYSYAHVVNTLDEVAQDATGITSAISITIDDIYDIIGEKNVDKSSNPEYGKIYKYYCDDTTNGQVYYKIQNADGSWPTTGSQTGKSKFTYTNSKKETRTIGTLADGTTINKGEVVLQNDYFTYTLDFATQWPAIGSLATGSYWLASPCVGCASSDTYFYVRNFSFGDINNAHLFSPSGDTSYGSSGVRAVVSI